MTSERAIDVENLVKKYRVSVPIQKIISERAIRKELTAIDDLTFSVSKGEIYGVLGPNGAGKTTLIKVLATMLLPDEGNIRIMGHELPKNEKIVREMLGLSLGEYERTFHLRITGRQNLSFFSTLFDIPKSEIDQRIDEVLQLVGLEDQADKMYLEYSTGMKHKMAIARALLNHPQILLFDEPTAGLDAKTSRDIGNLVRQLTRDGTTIVYTTHRLEEAGNICDRILILNQGKKVVEKSPQELKKLYRETEVLQITVTSITDELILKLKGIDSVNDVYVLGASTFRVHCTEIDAALPFIVSEIRNTGMKIYQINSFNPSVEDVFLELTRSHKEGRK